MKIRFPELKPSKKQEILLKKIIRVIIYYFIFTYMITVYVIWKNFFQISFLVILFGCYIAYSEITRKKLEKQLIYNYHNKVRTKQFDKLHKEMRELNKNEK